MDNDKQISAICKCLQMINFFGRRRLIEDHRSHKLVSPAAVKLYIMAQLLQLESYDLITEQLRAHPDLRQTIGIDSVSENQMSRKTKALCTESLQYLFCQLIGQIQELTKKGSGISKTIGRLHLIDATDISLPTLLGSWARCGKRKTGVRLHTRVVVADPDTVFPDKVIASTVNVRESVVVMELTTDSDVTYVMDRGYEKCLHFERWVKDGKRFVVRVRDLLKLHPIAGTEREIPIDSPNVIRDVDVLTNKTTVPIRLIEFTDEKGGHYRVVTSRWDLPAAEIAIIYKKRWLIELFFKWVKQHLGLIKLFSYHEDAIWNHLFLSLIAFAVNLLLKLKLQTKKTQWTVLKLLRTYAFHPWEEFIVALNREPTRTSKGRQKTGNRRVMMEPQRIILNY
jgi:hypothetical protein